MNNNKEIFVIDPPNKLEKIPRAKYGSKQIHLWTGIGAKCRNRNARLFSNNEYKITCKTCLRWKKELFLEYEKKRKEQLELRRRVKERAKEINFKREKGEKFKHFVDRLNEELTRLFEIEKKKEEQAAIDRLTWEDIITLPLDRKLKFPLKINTLYNYLSVGDWEDPEESLNDYGVNIPKQKYEHILKKLLKLIQKQLKELK